MLPADGVTETRLSDSNRSDSNRGEQKSSFARWAIERVRVGASGVSVWRAFRFFAIFLRLNRFGFFGFAASSRIVAVPPIAASSAALTCGKTAAATFSRIASSGAADVARFALARNRYTKPVPSATWPWPNSNSPARVVSAGRFRVFPIF